MTHIMFLKKLLHVFVENTTYFLLETFYTNMSLSRVVAKEHSLLYVVGLVTRPDPRSRPTVHAAGAVPGQAGGRQESH